jgi:hypothetical protein
MNTWMHPFARHPASTAASVAGADSGVGAVGKDRRFRTLRTVSTRGGRGYGLAALLVAEALLSFAPLVVLGPAIGWPASLRSPAADQLRASAAAPGALALGYGLYLLYSLLIAPVMLGLAARVFGGLQQPWAATVAAFAVLSTGARAIGILRWLTVVPALAAAHAAADPAARTSIEVVFNAVNAYGGGIGELLGVSLFMAASLGLLGTAGALRGSLPIWLALPGLAVALALAAVPFGIPVAAAVTGLTLWMLGAAAWCLRRA